MNVESSPRSDPLACSELVSQKPFGVDKMRRGHCVTSIDFCWSFLMITMMTAHYWAIHACNGLCPYNSHP